MLAKHKLAALLSSRVHQADIKLPTAKIESHTIQDNNQSIKNGVVYEAKFVGDLRSETKPKRKGRKSKSQRQD